MILHLLEAENYMSTRRNLMTIAELYKIVIIVMPTSIIINCYYWPNNYAHSTYRR